VKLNGSKIIEELYASFNEKSSPDDPDIIIHKKNSSKDKIYEMEE